MQITTKRNENIYKDVEIYYLFRNGRINIINTLYRFNAITNRMLLAFFKDKEQILLKFAWSHKTPRISCTGH